MERSPESLQMLSPGTSHTFFVPTDQAFNRLGATRLERIMDDPAYLTKVYIFIQTDAQLIRELVSIKLQLK
jgi:uncharacterized surface protein with fasciclin (FAS1) repeats